MMNELINKIDRAIEKKAMDTGRMGTESVSVQLKLSDAEIKLFYDTEKYDGEHYFWEIEGGVLDITYTEEV